MVERHGEIAARFEQRAVEVEADKVEGACDHGGDMPLDCGSGKPNMAEMR
jgi:hypothetical protein